MFLIGVDNDDLMCNKKSSTSQSYSNDEFRDCLVDLTTVYGEMSIIYMHITSDTYNTSADQKTLKCQAWGV